MRIRHQGPFLFVEAPAKVNLTLQVLGQRPDGFHELETVMISLSLFDSLRFEPEQSGAVSVTTSFAIAGCSGDQGKEIISPEENLVLKAAKALREATGTKQGARISLLKRIPLQAGLGGGSSDAAAALQALNRLWDLGLSSRALHEVAATLGSDVNFFLDSIPLAVCRGRGEKISPVPLRRGLTFLIVQPCSGLSTAEVFRHFEPGEPYNGTEALLRQLAGRSRTPLARLPVQNALEKTAERLNRDVRETLNQLRRMTSGPVGMSGSGSACYAVFDSARQARRLLGQWKALSGCLALVARSCL